MAKHSFTELERGAWTLTNESNGQAMHSRIGPEAEARALYIEPANIPATLRHKDLVIWDVGMGAATNALLAFDAAEGLPRNLHVVSFENDLDGIRTALEHKDRMPGIAKYEHAIRKLLRDYNWHEVNLSWELHEGPYILTAAHAPEPDVVFWDFYAPATEPALWSVGSFKCALPKSKPSRLFTYSSAKKTKTSLLLAGWYVGTGPATDAKHETTQAATSDELLANPLSRSFLDGVAASDDPCPPGFSGTKRDLLDALARHPQFQ